MTTSAAPRLASRWPWVALYTALAGGVALGVALAIAVGVFSSSAAWWIPLGCLGLLGGVVLLRSDRVRRHPFLPLSIAFVLAAFALQRREGLQATEAIFALYYLSFFAVWYGLRLGVYRERLVQSDRDGAFVLFALIIAVSPVLSLLYGGDLGLIRNDLVALSLLGFYFPVREVCARYEHGARFIFGGLMVLATVALLRNLIATRESIATAAYAWEVARVRVTANEMTMTVGALLCASVAAHTSRRSRMLVAAVGFAALTVGVVLTQWRAYYVALLLGLIFLAGLAPARERGRLVVMVTIGGTLGTGLLYLVFGDGLLLLAYGLLDRLLSIGTATQADVSLINRFRENRAILAEIAKSPFIGHGVGVSFGFFDMVTHRTWVKPYAHNGFLTMWYKFGLIGLAGLLWMWMRTLVDTARVLRQHAIGSFDRTLMRGAFSILLALVPPFAVSAPFTTSDTVLCFMLVIGMAAGIHDRSQHARREEAR